MPKISPAQILLLSLLLNGCFCAAIAATAIALPSTWILLLALTVGCGLLAGITLWIPGSPTPNGFWLYGALPLTAAIALYFLGVSGSLNDDFKTTAAYLSPILFVLGTVVPVLGILWQRWRRWRKAAIASRQGLAIAVRSEVELRQQQSLHNAVRQYLVREPAQTPVARLWDVEVKMGKQPKQKLPPDRRILDVLVGEAKPAEKKDAEDSQLRMRTIAGIVLILGAPGSGKTSTVLELAGDLCDRALQDESAPVPVVLDLARWHGDRSLERWLVEEVTDKYDVTPQLTRELLASDRLLPLLDGLDELDSDRQEECLSAIGRSQREGHPLPLVISTCMDSYQQRQTRLRLHSAIGLKPLSVEQIEDYLLNSRSRELWENIQSDRNLLKLAKTPLLLNLMTVAYEEILIHSWKRLTSRDERQQYAINAYIRRQLYRDMDSRWYRGKTQPSAEQTKQWLRGLATGMSDRNLTVFSVEHLPAISLHSSWNSLQYPLTILLSCSAIYVLSFFAIYGIEVGKIYGFLFAAIVLSCAALVVVKASDIEIKTTSYQMLWLSAAASVSCCLLGLVSFQAIGAILSQINGKGTGVMYLLSVLFFIAAISPLLGLLGGILTGIPWIKHLSARLVLWRNGETPWNYTRFLNYLSERLFLKRVGNRYRFIHTLVRDRLNG